MSDYNHVPGKNRPPVMTRYVHMGKGVPRKFVLDLASNQKPLSQDGAAVIYANLWDLYT